MKIINFLASTPGRWLRGILGFALAVIGFSYQGFIWLALIGVVVFAAGVFDFCLFAPLFRQSLSGKKIRDSRK